MKELTENDIAPLWNSQLGYRCVLVAEARKHCLTTDEGMDRIRRVLEFANALVQKFGGGVSEAEVRERERKAYHDGAHHGVKSRLRSDSLSGQGGWHNIPSDSEIERFRDLLYPSLVQKPRAVSLSDGKDWSPQSRGGWASSFVVAGQRVGDFVSQPPCVTAEDFEKCAALLREEQQG